MIKIKWWLFMVWVSLRWIPDYNLGDEVVFQGRIWTLCQGVSRPVWTLGRIAVNNEYTIMEAHERDFRKRKTIRNYLRSFRSGYKFYKQSWYAIWVHTNSLSGAPVKKRKKGKKDYERDPYYP